MANEILAVPEDHLGDVIRILELGMVRARDLGVTIHPEVFEQLTKWCNEEKEYLTRG